MFDLPVLVELLDYLNDRDIHCLALTNRQLNQDIIGVKNNQCDECSAQGTYCFKRNCSKCYGKTCWSKALTYTELISRGNQKKIEKRFIVCDDCGIIGLGNHDSTSCQDCHQIYYPYISENVDVRRCTLCRKRICYNCMRHNYSRDNIPEICRGSMGTVMVRHNIESIVVCTGCFKE